LNTGLTHGQDDFRMVYCEGEYEICERRKLRLLGQSIPDSLMPQGTKLWPDGVSPPPEFRIPGL
jgi:hypothetical protein